MKYDITQRQQMEHDFWKFSPTESPDADSLDHLLEKLGEARVWMEKIARFESLFAVAHAILELGAGQGWTSAMLKRIYPEKRIITTDISWYALASLAKWERIFKATIREKVVCRSYEIPLPSQAVDLVFCYAAAHHFVAHRRTLAEIKRVLTPGGTCLYLHEPSCRQSLYRIALWRVTNKRSEVPEDVLVYKKIEKIARSVGLKPEIHFHPTTTHRAPVETMYYFLLQRMSLLTRLLPCTVDFVFRKDA